MKIKFKLVPNPPRMPESYVTVAVYVGNIEFPLTMFYVLRVWWESIKRGPSSLEFEED